jgi:MFS family permease
LRKARAPLAVLFLVNVLNYYDRQALGAVTEPLRREFALSDAQIGALSTLFIIVYAGAGLPLGRLADTWSRRKLMAIGVSVWAALTALGGAAASYAMLAATRLGVGIGEAVCAPAANSWIGSLVPTGQRARAMAGFMMAVPVGVMLSSAATGPAAQAWGWRAALALAAAPAILLVPALLWLDEPEREPANRQESSATPLSLLRIPALAWIAGSGAILNFALYSFSAFLPAFLKRYHGLSVAQAGLWTGIGSGAAGVAGAVLAGVWGDRIIVRWPNGRLLLAAGAALVAAPLAWAAIAIPAGEPTAALVLIMPAYGLLQTYYGLVYAAINDIVAPGLRGTAMAGYLLVTYLGGAAFGPLLTGMLSDRLARRVAGAARVSEAARAIGLHQAMYLIPAMALVLAAVLWAGARAGRRYSVVRP